MAVGRGSKVSVKARLGWRLLRHSRILVALQVEDAARRRQYDGRQGSAASKSAEAVVSADLEVRLLGGKLGGGRISWGQTLGQNPRNVPKLEFPAS
jgi:hypothetical protein